MLFLTIFGCLYIFFPVEKEEFVDNPNHDFDKDGLTENDGDCDDNDKDIQKLVWYVDADGMVWIGYSSNESCVRPEGYAERKDDCK